MQSKLFQNYVLRCSSFPHWSAVPVLRRTDVPVHCKVTCSGSRYQMLPSVCCPRWWKRELKLLVWNWGGLHGSWVEVSISVSIRLQPDPWHLSIQHSQLRRVPWDLLGSWYVVMCYFVEAWIWIIRGCQAGVWEWVTQLINQSNPL